MLDESMAVGLKTIQAEESKRGFRDDSTASDQHGDPPPYMNQHKNHSGREREKLVRSLEEEEDINKSRKA